MHWCMEIHFSTEALNFTNENKMAMYLLRTQVRFNLIFISTKLSLRKYKICVKRSDPECGRYRQAWLYNVYGISITRK